MKTTAAFFVLVFLTAFTAFSQGDNLIAKNSSNMEIKLREMELPAFVGGQEAMATFINSEIKYPALAFKQRLEGTVLVNFRISKEGKILNPYVSQGVHPNLDAEALRLVESMPDWIPARQNGEPREVAYQIPVRFALRN
ncbi:energy transducer TonB [Cecembia calidifontis]|jgi:protein TonB|uniref:Protein TonB n=1 Tax=Cecembia calidifontis TaxID=1187080 RepID=A0A4Q7PCN9_9BACT|nr:energy transducer TonB [Cecembia calidifontis]RZS97360.1 protein TonB [Cecembia calidifontis]